MRIVPTLGLICLVIARIFGAGRIATSTFFIFFQTEFLRNNGFRTCEYYLARMNNSNCNGDTCFSVSHVFILPCHDNHPPLPTCAFAATRNSFVKIGCDKFASRLVIFPRAPSPKKASMARITACAVAYIRAVHACQHAIHK